MPFDRTPVFNVAFSGLPNTGQLDVFQPGNPTVTNDQIRMAINDGETSAKGMIVFENLLAATTDPLASFTAEVYQFQGNAGEGVMRFLFQASDDTWYASDPSDALPGGFQTREVANVPAANWYEFTPFNSGVSSIASTPAAGLDFTNVQTVGAYWDIGKGAGLNAAFSVGYFQATTGTVGTEGDLDGDGDVDGTDFLIYQRDDGSAQGLMDFQDNYGTEAPATSLSVSAVPEPSCFLLFALGTIGLSVTRRRP